MIFRSFPDWFHNLRSYIPPSSHSDLLHQNCDCFRVSSPSFVLFNTHWSVIQCTVKPKRSRAVDCDPVSLKTSQDKNLSLQEFSDPTNQGSHSQGRAQDEPEPTSPIVSLNEVSSSRQDPPDQSRSPSPSSFTKSFVYEKDFGVAGPGEGLDSAVSPTVTSPLLAPPGSPLVPLLFPCPSVSHSVVYMSQYMNPFLPPAHPPNVIEKKKTKQNLHRPCDWGEGEEKI